MPDSARHLLLVRHGQSTWNARGVWQGQADPPLSALGEAQAKDAADRLAGSGLVRVVASDLQRARRTAEIVADGLGLAFEVDPDLREIDVGDWTGLTRAEIEARWPGEVAAWSEGRSESPPGGESRDSLAARARAGVGRAVAASSPGDRLLLVTHGALIRNLDRALGLPPEAIANLVGRWYEAGEGGSIVAGALVTLAGPGERTLSPSP